MWSWKLSISIQNRFLRAISSLRVSRTVSQLIMRVHKPTVEYKLALQERPKGQKLDVLLYKQF